MKENNSQLTAQEEKFLKNFLETTEHKKYSIFLTYLYSGLIIAGGLALIIAGIVLTAKNPTDKAVYWILIPGISGGMIITFLGFFFLKKRKLLEMKRKLAEIIKKLQ